MKIKESYKPNLGFIKDNDSRETNIMGYCECKEKIENINLDNCKIICNLSNNSEEKEILIKQFTKKDKILLFDVICENNENFNFLEFKKEFNNRLKDNLLNNTDISPVFIWAEDFNLKKNSDISILTNNDDIHKINNLKWEITHGQNTYLAEKEDTKKNNSVEEGCFKVSHKLDEKVIVFNNKEVKTEWME